MISDNVCEVLAQFLAQNRGLLNLYRKGKYRIYASFMRNVSSLDVWLLKWTTYCKVVRSKTGKI